PLRKSRVIVLPSTGVSPAIETRFQREPLRLLSGAVSSSGVGSVAGVSVLSGAPGSPSPLFSSGVQAASAAASKRTTIVIKIVRRASFFFIIFILLSVYIKTDVPPAATHTLAKRRQARQKI